MKRSNQNGLTLVELMVALTIGSLVLLFLVEIFAQASHNARVQRNVAWLQQDGRVAIEAISREVRLAGFVPAGYSVDSLTACSAPTNCGATVPASNCAVFGANDIDIGGGIKADTIATSYIADGSMADCNGGPPPSTIDNANELTRVVSCIDIKDSAADKDTVPNLRLGCRNLGLNSDFTPNGKESNPGMSSALNNIERLEIVYGVSMEALPDVQNLQFLPANAVTDWTRVISVRISLLVRSRDSNLVSGAQTYWFDTDGDGNPQSTNSSDGYLRQAFSSVVLLRNRVP